MEKVDGKNYTYWYGRNSTDKQDDSQYQQWEVCSKWAKENDYIIVKKFYDDGYSGTTLKRPELQRMLKELKRNEVKFLLVYHSDRLARDMFNGMNLFNYIESLGVILLSVTEPYVGDNTATAKLSRNLNMSVAQYHVDNAKQLVTRAMRSKANRNEFNGGVPPYGFKIINKKYVIDENEADAIRIIFRMIANNASYEQISNLLNEKGFRLRSGKPFSRKTIFSDFITNKKYKGVYVYGRTKKGVNNKYNQHRECPLQEQIINEGGVPAIVSEKLWDEANRVIDNRRRHRGAGTAKEYYLLSGTIECSCGCVMHGNRSTSQRGKYEFISYRCSSKSKSKTKNLKCRDIKRDTLERYILKNLNFYFNDDVVVSVIEYVANYVIRKYYLNNDNELRQLKSRLKGVEKSLSNLVNVLEKMEDDDNLVSIVSRVKDVEEEKEMLLKEIRRLEDCETSVINDISRNQIREHLTSMFVEINGEHDRRRLAQIIGKCVKKIIVDREKIQIIYDLDFVFNGLNNYISMSTIVMREGLIKEIKNLWYQLIDKKSKIMIDYKIENLKKIDNLYSDRGNPKKLSIFMNG